MCAEEGDEREGPRPGTAHLAVFWMFIATLIVWFLVPVSLKTTQEIATLLMPGARKLAERLSAGYNRGRKRLTTESTPESSSPGARRNAASQNLACYRQLPLPS